MIGNVCHSVAVARSLWLNSSSVFFRSAKPIAQQRDARCRAFRQHDTQNESTSQRRDRDAELAVTNPKGNSKYQAQKFPFLFFPFFNLTPLCAVQITGWLLIATNPTNFITLHRKAATCFDQLRGHLQGF
jgi:hypothetical protein